MQILQMYSSGSTALFNKKKCAILDVQVVGMYHVDRRELEEGEVYKVEADPSNIYDSNAIAVWVSNNWKFEERLRCAGSRIIDDKANLKPLFQVAVKNRLIGPHQKVLLFLGVQKNISTTCASRKHSTAFPLK